MEKLEFTVINNIKQGEDYFVLHLVCNKLLNIIPGQFVNVEIKNKFLNRPISVCDVNDYELVLAIKINGSGTLELSSLKKDDKVNVLLPLGNGIDFNYYKSSILLIGGGIGCAPLIYIGKKAKELGLEVTSVLGFKDRNNTLLLEQFSKYSDHLYVAYDSDKENVVTKVNEYHLNDMKYFACGPIIMEKELAKVCNDGYFSLEARMGCGFGTCMGCSTGFKDGRKRICKDGPIFKKDEIIWENLM